MFTRAERLISIRNLNLKKEGFLKIISLFSFLGIMLGVAILIIVMSVMNGFKTDLTNKILGLNPHIVVQPNSFQIDESYISKLKKDFEEMTISRTYSGEGIVISNENTKGVILKGIDKSEKNIVEFFDSFISQGNLDNFNSNKVFIGSELSFNFNLEIGDTINLMTSSFVGTPLGNLPKQEIFEVADLTTGFIEFDENIIFSILKMHCQYLTKEQKIKILKYIYKIL